MRSLTLARSLAMAALIGCGGESTPVGATAPSGDEDAGARAPTPAADAAPGDDAGDDGGGDPARDPNADGPFAYAEKDAQMTVAATSDTVAVHAAYPSGAGPFPLVLLAHGFQLPPEQYYGYLKRLASFGYVAMTVDFPTSLGGNDNPRQAKAIIAAIDWAKTDPSFGSSVDTSAVGTTGHSLGGKLALLAATMDARIKAVIALDPVDGGGPTGCAAPACVNVAALMPSLAIPTAFLGETTDATGSLQACAPAASNYTTFYAKAQTPSLQVTLTGANHMSFLDDVSTCGLTCAFCNPATAPNAQITATARAFMTAFFERHLRSKGAYDAHLTGPTAQARYVTTGQAVIIFK
ncbi:MAG: alpha/beta fold hydrolase [Labilithrix sp.]|nr:alpha/beta fold hydrolase [Labilithrix sp.]